MDKSIEPTGGYVLHTPSKLLGDKPCPVCGKWPQFIATANNDSLNLYYYHATAKPCHAYRLTIPGKLAGELDLDNDYPRADSYPDDLGALQVDLARDSMVWAKKGKGYQVTLIIGLEAIKYFLEVMDMYSWPQGLDPSVPYSLHRSQAARIRKLIPDLSR